MCVYSTIIIINCTYISIHIHMYIYLPCVDRNLRAEPFILFVVEMKLCYYYSTNEKTRIAKKGPRFYLLMYSYGYRYSYIVTVTVMGIVIVSV